jgi:hypothetical protein
MSRARFRVERPASLLARGARGTCHLPPRGGRSTYPERLIIGAGEYGKRASSKRKYARYQDDSELTLNHPVDLGLVEVHPPGAGRTRTPSRRTAAAVAAEERSSRRSSR